MTSFLKIAQQLFVCEYFLLIPIDVPSFKLIEGQIKELQGVVLNTPPRAENDQKSPGRIGLIVCVHVIEGRASLTRRIARCTRIRNCN